LKQRSLSDPGPAKALTTSAAGESRDLKARARDGRRLFVLDTNVLMHDPHRYSASRSTTSICRWSCSKNWTRTRRPLRSVAQRAAGESFPRRHDPRCDQRTHRSWTATAERIFRQSRQETLHRTVVLPDTPALERAAGEPARSSQRQRDTRADTRIANEKQDARVILVSKDINLRIKAAVLAYMPRITTATRPWRTQTSSTAA